MLTKYIKFKNELISGSKKNKNIQKYFNELKNQYFKNKIPLLKSFDKNFRLAFTQKFLRKFKKKNYFNIIGMGGSSLGAKAIYSFLKNKIKKNFFFFDDLNEIILNNYFDKKKSNNIYISKSGNTIETLVNLNLISKKNKNGSNVFITENKKNSLLELSKKLKAEVIEHKDFIGGRYSVMSEVGMLPAALMNLNVSKFKQLNQLMLNKKFVNTIIENVHSIYALFKKKKVNSIILNYDPQLNDFCLWYQQLVSESLGKKKKGILPIVSTMPKDNHSLLQHYLDGTSNTFFTIFSSKHSKEYKINKNLLPKNFKYLSNKNLESIINSQRFINSAFKKSKAAKMVPYGNVS